MELPEDTDEVQYIRVDSINATSTYGTFTWNERIQANPFGLF